MPLDKPAFQKLDGIKKRDADKCKKNNRGKCQRRQGLGRRNQDRIAQPLLGRNEITYDRADDSKGDGNLATREQVWGGERRTYSPEDYKF